MQGGEGTQVPSPREPNSGDGFDILNVDGVSGRIQATRDLNFRTFVFLGSFLIVELQVDIVSGLEHEPFAIFQDRSIERTRSVLPGLGGRGRRLLRLPVFGLLLLLSLRQR